MDMNDVWSNASNPLVASPLQMRVVFALTERTPGQVVDDSVDCGACADLLLWEPGALRQARGASGSEDMNPPAAL